MQFCFGCLIVEPPPEKELVTKVPEPLVLDQIDMTPIEVCEKTEN